MIRLISFIIDLNNADIPYFFYGLIRVLPGKVLNKNSFVSITNMGD